MKKRKLFLAILAIIPMGIFAQEIRYVTVPTSQDATPAPATSTSAYQMQSQTTESVDYSSSLFRDELKVSQEKAIHTTFLKNKPQDNWFFSLSGGLGMLQSEESRYRDLADQFQFTGGLALGKWWSPVWGLRLSASAAKLKGFAVNGNYAPLDPGYYFMGSWLTGKGYASAGHNDIREGVQNSYTDGNAVYGARLIAANYLNLDDVIATDKGTGYSYDVPYFGASLDLMLNLKNYFTRYNPKAVFNPVLYAGLGWAHTFKADAVNPELFQQLMNEATEAGNNRIINSAYGKSGQIAVNSLMVKTGMQLNFRLSDAVDFFLDGQWLILPEYFDRRVGDDMLHDWVLNAQVGFTYKFNERFFYEPLCSSKTVYVNNPAIIASRSECCEDLLASLRRIENILDRQTITPVKDINADLESLKVIVHFVIDKWEVRQSEMYKLDEIAKFMAKYPRVRVSVSGYADVQTAYPEYNMKLSLKRAEEVARILGSKYGIDRSRLRVEHYGDTVQPFEINELNRAVIAFDIPEYGY